MNLDRLNALAERGRHLMARPRASGDWYRIANADSDRAEVFIYDVIDEWGGVAPSQFVRDLRSITAKSIDLHINSPGGVVFDAVAIYSALKNHPATVDVTVDGLAASAASFIAQAGDSIAIEKPAKMMIHDASGLVLGNAKDMRAMADILDDLSDTIAGIYSDRAGKSTAHWREAMQAETWYGAHEAVKAGLADRVNNDSKAAPEDRRSQIIRARAHTTLGRAK